MNQALQGNKGLIVGIANEHGITWGCARVLRSAGAELPLAWRRTPTLGLARTDHSAGDASSAIRRIESDRAALYESLASDRRELNS